MNEDSPLVHGWSGPDAIPAIVPAAEPALAIAGACIPEEEIRRRSKDWHPTRPDPQGWQILKTPKAVVRGDIPVEALQTIGVYAEEMEAILRSAIGGPRAGKFFFKIFNACADFRQFAQINLASNAESFYSPLNKEASFWFGQYASPELFQRGFSHEFTHAYMDIVWERVDPLWFAEGMAEYFSNLDWQAGRLVLGQAIPEVLNELQAGPWVPIRELFEMGRVSLYGPLFRRLYAQAWSVIHFLFDNRPEVIQAMLKKGAAGVPDPRHLESEWRKHVERILEARTEEIR